MPVIPIEKTLELMILFATLAVLIVSSHEKKVITLSSAKTGDYLFTL